MKRYRLALTVLLALLFCMPVSPCALAAEAGEGVIEQIGRASCRERV